MSSAITLASLAAPVLAPTTSARRRDARVGRRKNAPNLAGLHHRPRAFFAAGPSEARRDRLSPTRAVSGDDAPVADTSEEEAEADRLRREAADRANLQTTLRTGMEAAVNADDFELAARLRDELNEALERDELHVARRDLATAIAEERYDDAARRRDLVASLEPPPPPPPEKVPCASDVTTDGVNVAVTSTYVASRSRPENGQYFFAYDVRITNRTDKIVQLRHRRWTITDGSGRVEEVAGPGVIGQQPVLLPGQTFEYASACPLRTPTGTMEGEYTFAWMVTTPAAEAEADQADDGEDGEGGRGGGAKREDEEELDEFSTALTFLREGEQPEFAVEIGLFGLDADVGASTQ